MFSSNDREMLPEEIHQSRSLSSSSPASSFSYEAVWIPGSSPPAQMWGRSLVAASAVKQTLIYVVHVIALDMHGFQNIRASGYNNARAFLRSQTILEFLQCILNSINNAHGHSE